MKERITQLIERLKLSGHRITPQRVAVIKAICVDDGHPSVDAIYHMVRAEFPMTSLATVYKTIGIMKEMGEVLELEFSREANRYDGRRPFPHPHVICTDCGRIMDPDVDGIERVTRQIMEATGFDIDTHRLDFYGRCPRCRQRSSGPAE